MEENNKLGEVFSYTIETVSLISDITILKSDLQHVEPEGETLSCLIHFTHLKDIEESGARQIK